MFHYFVAYSYPGGFGNVSVMRDEAIESHLDLNELASTIKRNAKETHGRIINDVVVLNVQRFPL